MIGSIADTPALLRGEAGTVVTRDADGMSSPMPPRERSHMSEHAAEPVTKSKFSLPSAYTILFALIVLAAIATWVIPAGTYDLNADGEPVPGPTTRSSRNPRGSSSTRTAPINGMYGIEDETGNINYYNSGSSSARSTSRCSSS